MSSVPLPLNEVAIPRFLYGTAWKEADTQRLVELAIQQGFRGIDTANQRKHYFEAAVGDGIAAMIAKKLVTREELFLQTKFTFRGGQDHRLPYDPKSPVTTQVEDSFASSLEHLHTNYLDSYVLHGPMVREGLSPLDWEAWRAMETLHDSQRTRFLGVSNVSLGQLRLLCEGARIRPRFVQNRCYAIFGWDRAVREFCKANDIIYQGFSLLTANVQFLSQPEVKTMARRYGKTIAQIAFRFALDVGMLPLTGTTNPEHMRSDLDLFDFHLTPEEIAWMENSAHRGDE